MSHVVPQIFRYESIASTNSTLKERALQGAQEGTVIVAKQQTLGRGRGERQWHSPAGGLYLSLLLTPNFTIRPTDLALLAGAVMTQTVKSFFPSSLSVGVKWPNDCLIQGKKVGGVLCETIGEPTRLAIIVGVGININVPSSELKAFDSRPFKATSFLEVSQGKSFELDKVLESFLKFFFKAYEVYQLEGFRFIQTLWEKECLFIGKKIELKETGLSLGKNINSASIQGTFLGIDESGALVLSTSQGERKSFVTGEITCCWS